MTIVRITDGTTTATITDNTNYILQEGWIPNVARLRNSDIGGRSEYEDVLEEMPFSIKGTTVALAYANLQTLYRLIDQATRYHRGDRDVAAVRIQYQANGSTLSAPLEAYIIGQPPEDGTPPVSLSASFDGINYTMTDLMLRFIRRGRWLHPTVESASSGAVTNPGVMLATFATTHNTWSPVRITLTGDELYANSGVNSQYFSRRDGYVVVSGASAKFRTDEGESFSVGANCTLTSTADAARVSNGGSVGRMVQTGAPRCYAYKATTGQVGRHVGVFICYRPESTANAARIWANLPPVASGDYGWDPSYSTPVSNINIESTFPVVQYLGSVYAPSGYGGVQINLEVTSTLVTINIDWVVIVGLEGTQICKMWNYNVGGQAIATQLMTVATFSNVIDPGELTRREPSVHTLQSSIEYPYGYEFDDYPSCRGNTIAAMVLCAYRTGGGGGVGDFYKIVTNAAAAEQFTMTADRYRAYITPE